MGTKFVVLAVMILSTAAYKKLMLEENKTPKEILITRSAPFKGTCDECKMFVQRFADAMKNPQKLKELKDLLRLLCHETSYEDECVVFVDQLDRFVKKFGSYLDNPQKVCQEIHLCANQKIEQFHQLNTRYGRKGSNENSERDLICEECQFAAQELKYAIEDEESQKRLKKFISEQICGRMGSLQGKCDLMLEEFLPELIEEIDKLLQDSRTFCADLSLCKRFMEPLISRNDDTDSALYVNVIERSINWRSKIKLKQASDKLSTALLQPSIAHFRENLWASQKLK